MGKSRGKEFALDFLADVAGGFIQAVALHCFIDNIDIAPGGLQRYNDPAQPSDEPADRYTDIFDQHPASDRVLDLSGGRKRAIKTLKTVAIMTVILDGLVTPYFPVYSGTRWCPAFSGSAQRGSAWRSYLCAFHNGWRRYRREASQKFRPHMQTGRRCIAGYGSRDHSPVHGGVPEY